MTILDVLFWVYALAAAGGAIAVVLTHNVVRMAFWLIVSLGSTAGLFFLLNADFVGTAQLLVYVGGTLVLLIFGVMLTASGPFINMRTNPGEGVLAGVIAVSLLAAIASSVCRVDWEDVSQRTAGPRGFNPQQELAERYYPPQSGSTSRAIGAALLGVRVDRDLGTARTNLSPGYLLPFEIASVHLLVVLVGAAYLARAKRRVNDRRDSEEPTGTQR